MTPGRKIWDERMKNREGGKYMSNILLQNIQHKNTKTKDLWCWSINLKCIKGELLTLDSGMFRQVNHGKSWSSRVSGYPRKEHKKKD